MPEEEGFRSIGQRPFGRDTCFLCRCELTRQNRTEEHVIPKWVQARFDLWNDTLELLNGTTIPYRQLTIPCCFECNNKHLEPLESQVRDATLLGAAAVEELGKGVLFLWLGKIFFGLIYKESLIPLDRRQPMRGNIMRQDDLERFSAHHVFLQSARMPFRWTGMFPASIFVYDLRQPSQPGEGFDLLDNYSAMTIAIRLGHVGLIAALQDGEAMQCGLSGHFTKYRPLTLHRNQFHELCSLLFYKTHLIRNAPFFIMAEQPDGFVVHQHLLYPRFDAWDNEEYYRLFARLSRIPFEQLYFGDSHKSFLDDEQGSPRPWPE